MLFYHNIEFDLLFQYKIKKKYNYQIFNVQENLKRKLATYPL